MFYLEQCSRRRIQRLYLYLLVVRYILRFESVVDGLILIRKVEHDCSGCSSEQISEVFQSTFMMTQTTNSDDSYRNGEDDAGVGHHHHHFYISLLTSVGC